MAFSAVESLVDREFRSYKENSISIFYFSPKHIEVDLALHEVIWVREIALFILKGLHSFLKDEMDEET
jgi:hypothetical protein